MENQQAIIDDTLAERKIVLSSGAQKDLRTTGAWGILMSIFGFIYTAIIIFAGITILTLFQTSSGIIPANQQGIMNGMAIFMIIVGLLFIIPVVFLLRFSINALRANSSMRTYTLEEAISHLKLSFMTLGIITLLSILLYFVWVIYVATATRGF